MKAMKLQLFGHAKNGEQSASQVSYAVDGWCL